jgi:DNA adenine methylase
MKPKRPILRYHGGKFRTGPWIISHFPPHDIYVEPYAGAASVLLQKTPARNEVVNDLDDRIISAFRVLRDPVQSERLQTLLRFTPYSIVEYMAARERSHDPVEDARRLIILGHQSHGSTGASGKKSGWRRGMRPRGPASTNEWSNLHDAVTSWGDRLRSVFLESGPAIDVIKYWDGDDTLFYIDPPYLAEVRTSGLASYHHEMTNDDHRELAAVLHECKGMVILSGYDSGLYRDLYPGWQKVSRKTVADQRKPVVEVLWLNAAAAEKQDQMLLAV